MTIERSAVNLEDVRRLALRNLPDFISSYVETGGGSGAGLRRNIAAWQKFTFLTRSLVDVTPVSTKRTLFGKTYSLPFGISAVANMSIFWPRSDEILAGVACEANIPFMLSGASSGSVERVARIAPVHTWFQLYVPKDFDVAKQMVERARDAGVQVLVLTVDYPVRNRNEAAQRSGVSYTGGLDWRRWPSIALDLARHPGWTWRYLRNGGMPMLETWERYAPKGSNAAGVARYFASNYPLNLLWEDIDRFRSLWPGNLVIKGLFHPDDVARAAHHGADAVIISNHGGNKLDSMPASADMLVMAKAVDHGKMPIMVDGGIRCGDDVLKSIALGADFCFLGRAALYGVAAAGLAGARRVVDILRNELAYAQAMVGSAAYDEINSSWLLRDE